MKVSVVRIARGHTVFYFRAEVEMREKDGRAGARPSPTDNQPKSSKLPKPQCAWIFVERSTWS